LSQLLLLPGLDGTGKLFNRFVSMQLPNFSCEVVAYGESFARLDDYINVVKAQLSTNAKTVLVAESFSGPIAAHVALRYREQVTGIVFAASFVTPPHPALLNLISIMPAPTFSAMRATLINQFCVNGVSDKMVVEEASVIVNALESVVIKRRLMLLANLAKSQLAPMDIPVLSLRATQDRLITKAATSSIANIFPNTTSIDVKAPHFLLQACPEECWRHIEKFAASCFA
jgi:pimeloyl-[acyl-carrier protein] methyl ester esterase